jgi:O-antigen/teichoic acid export membrane protein
MIREFFSVSLANIALRFSGLIIVPFLSNSFTVSQMGLYDVIWTAIIFFELFLGFKLADACYRYALKNKRPEYYFALGFFLIAIVSLAALLVALVSLTIFPLDYTYIILVGLLIVVSKLFISLYLEFLRAKENFTAYRHSGFMITIGYIFNCFGQAYLYTGFDVASFYTGFLLVNCFYIIYMWAVFPSNLYLNVLKLNKRNELNKIFSFGLRLQPSALSWWFLRFSQRWIVMFYLGLDAVATVTISSYPFLVFSALSTYMYMAAQRVIFKWHDEDQNKDEGEKVTVGQYRIIRSIYLLLSLGIFILVEFLSEYIFPEVLYSREAALICLLGGFFMAIGSYFGNVYMAQLRVVAASFTSIVSAAFGIFATWWALGQFGVNGFSVGVLAGGALLFILRSFDPNIYRTFFKLKVDLVFYIAVIVSYWAVLESSMSMSIIYLFMLCGFLVLLMNYDNYSRDLMKLFVVKFVRRS